MRSGGSVGGTKELQGWGGRQGGRGGGLGGPSLIFGALMLCPGALA